MIEEIIYLSSKQLRSNTILKGYYGGYTIKDIKVELKSKDEVNT